VNDLIAVDVGQALRHALFTIGVAYVCCGVLAGRFLAKAGPGVPEDRRSSPRTLGPVEAGILLGSICGLFGLFVATQLPYLFGGRATLTQTPGLTAAAYARRGFFELLAVMALAVPLLLLIQWATRRGSTWGTRLTRAGMGLAVVLLLAILASAMLRLALYADLFGLTETRIYAAAILTWLGLVLLLLAATTVLGRRRPFVFAATLAGFAVLLGLNAVGPDSLVASTNLARSGRPVDLSYLSGLSADAVPHLVEALPSLAPPERDRLTAALQDRWAGPARADRRSWNRARSRAHELVAGLPPNGGRVPARP
jgi:hypothetical protein